MRGLRGERKKERERGGDFAQAFLSTRGQKNVDQVPSRFLLRRDGKSEFRSDSTLPQIFVALTFVYEWLEQAGISLLQRFVFSRYIFHNQKIAA